MAKEKKPSQGEKRSYVSLSVEQVREAIDRMIGEYYQNGTLPTDFRLLELTGVSRRTMDGWYNGARDPDEEDTEESINGDTFKSAMHRLVQFRSQICVEEIAANPKATGWIYLSKQARWGGFMDSVQRTETKGTADIKISLMGSDGKPVKNG